MRLTTTATFPTTGTTSWTAPAGVTTIIITPGRSSTGTGLATGGVGTVLTVVPNTTYTIVIGSGTATNPSTFGAIYSVAIGGLSNGSSGIPLTLTWMDG